MPQPFNPKKSDIKFYIGIDIGERSCGFCNKIFVPKQKHAPGKFCSASCRISFANTKRVWSDKSKRLIGIKNSVTHKGSSNPNYKGGGIECFCQECKKVFKVAQHAISTQKHSGKFCSHDCYYSNRYKLAIPDEQIYLNKLFSRNLSRLLTKTQETTSTKWFSLVGYTLKDIRTHLESKFLFGMSWSNYGEWHVDHVKPRSFFRYTDPTSSQFKECWALSNLQPLWALDNLKKGGCNRAVNRKLYSNKPKNLLLCLLRFS